MTGTNWEVWDFKIPNQFLRGDSLENWTEDRDSDVRTIHRRVAKSCIGLVTGFFAYPNVYAAAAESKEESRLGYREFIGDISDTKGVFVWLEEDHAFEEHREELNTLWTQQAEAATQHRNDQRANLK